MIFDTIANIGIDRTGRVYVTPSTVRLERIYLEEMEVGWDLRNARLIAPHSSSRAALASPEWWFARILEAAKEHKCLLKWSFVTNLDKTTHSSRHAFQLAYLGSRWKFFSIFTPTRTAALPPKPNVIHPKTSGSFSIAFRKGFPVISLRGEINISIAESFRQFLIERIPQSSSLTLFDFYRVEFFDSTALGVLFQHIQAPRIGILFGIPPWIMRIFHGMYFKKVPRIEMVPDMRSAMRLAQQLDQEKRFISLPIIFP